jgi:hypothetical protein
MVMYCAFLDINSLKLYLNDNVHVIYVQDNHFYTDNYQDWSCFEVI